MIADTLVHAAASGGPFKPGDVDDAGNICTTDPRVAISTGRIWVKLEEGEKAKGYGWRVVNRAGRGGAVTLVEVER